MARIRMGKSFSSKNFHSFRHTIRKKRQEFSFSAEYNFMNLNEGNYGKDDEFIFEMLF
jgi:hypothetical protein